jgi:hypothetical protein
MYLCAVSVKLFLFMPWKHMERERMKVPLILNLATKSMWVASRWIGPEGCPRESLEILALPTAGIWTLDRPSHRPVTTVKKKNTYYLQAVTLTSSVQTTDTGSLTSNKEKNPRHLTANISSNNLNNIIITKPGRSTKIPKWAELSRTS